MNDKYKVSVSKKATQMLVSYAAFSACESKSAAERLIVSFETAANSLEYMPRRCPKFTGDCIPNNMYRFVLFEKRYMLLFQIQDDTVYIDYVLDCRQGYGWLLD